MKTHTSLRHGGTTMIVVAIVATVTIAGMTTFMVRRGTLSNNETGARDEYVVQRGSFDITIPASGELAALRQVEIRNRLELRASITEIVEEGKTVVAGDVLIRFAEDEIRNKIKDAEDGVNNAQAALISAQSSLDIRISSNESEVAKSNLDVRLAELALEAWTEGEDPARIEELDLALEAARINKERLEYKLTQSEKLLEEGFISKDEFERDRILLIEADARLKQAVTDKKVYLDYERIQYALARNSDLQQATDERERTKERHKAEMQTVHAEVTSKQHQFQSRQERLADLNQQLDYCVVTAPTGGLVVYASSLESSRRMYRSDAGAPQVGAELRPNELVIVLPDTSQMIASIKVNEALSGLIKPGQAVVVTSDAIADAVVRGEVLSVGVLAESGGWRDPNRRDYTIKVKLTDGNDIGLKPSMRCQAEIYVGRVEEALFVPLQSVFRKGPLAYAFVPQGSGFAERMVTLGEASELYREVRSGLSEGDVVLLRKPQPREIVSRLADNEAPTEGRAAAGPPNRRPSAEQHNPRPDGEVSRTPRQKRPASGRPASKHGPVEG